ncbi:MAG: cache domain-containing protein [Desulfovibrio sp.]|uniref:cache domain-containing protein n=1 Tax=Desulfovibrio sp. 7SRBS1 TaxID=3378064 RepID=UPI003B3E38F0
MTISKQLLIRLVCLISISFVLMFLLVVYMDYRQFSINVQNVQGSLITANKHWVRAEAKGAVSYVELQKARAMDNLKSELRHHVIEASNILWNIYSKYKNTKSIAEIKHIAVEALRPIRFSGGRGYYFAFSMDGHVELHGTNPSLEGSTDAGTVNAEGRYIVRELIDLASERKEGYLEYLWPKPKFPGENFRKLSYVRYFAPFDWTIGSGEYLDDAERKIKRQVLEHLASITYGDGGYIFAGNYEGVTLLGPYKGRSILDIQDREGRYVVRQMIAAAQKGGGFVSYYMSNVPGPDKTYKVSYVEGVDGWNWFVGAGIHPFSVRKLASETERDALNMLYIKLGTYILLVGLVIFVLVWGLRRFSNSLKRDFDTFNNFLRKDQQPIQPLDTFPLQYQEFRDMGEALNSMVERVNEAEKELIRSLAEKDTLLKEIHHRVKNNLQVVSSLLHLQSGNITDPTALQVLRDSSQRVMSMSHVHEQLYQSNNLGSIDINLYIKNLWEGLRRSMGVGKDIELEIEGGSVDLPLHKAVPCGLILNELLTNVFKHGFSKEKQQGRVEVALKRVGQSVTISVSDNGQGMPREKDINEIGGLGLQLVVNLAAQLGGGVDWYYDDEGFTVKVSFSLENKE